MVLVARDLLLAEGSWKPGFGVIHGGERGLDRPDQAREIGHVGDFEEYQRDLAMMFAFIESHKLAKPLILLGHSMGGCIGLRALHNQVPVKGAVFTGPMWEIEFSPLMGVIAKLLAKILNATPLKMALAPSTKAETYVLTQEFAGNLLTNDAETYQNLVDQAKKRPEVTLGGPTISWLHAAFCETAKLQQLPAPSVPTVTFLGDQEQIVSKKAVYNMMERWPSGRLEIAEGCQHEILMENKATRDRVFRAIRELAEAPR
ncbi:alpha/beta hydrolase [Akkermansiaceae bacterium]|nr:alpha/beta hydrolase [Akkermansiaceae bacterium]